MNILYCPHIIKIDLIPIYFVSNSKLAVAKISKSYSKCFEIMIVDKNYLGDTVLV